MPSINGMGVTVLQKNFVVRVVLLTSIILALTAIGFFLWKKESLLNLFARSTPPAVQRVTTTRAIFKSETFPVLSKTLVKVSYIPSLKPSEIWLTLDTKDEAAPVILLINHPVLSNLDWSYKENVNYTLFQKKPTYKSVEEFFKNPPLEETIYADPLIAERVTLTGVSVKPLSEEIDLSEADYILSTYHHSYKEGEFTVSEAIVDASNAYLTEGKLTWALHFPQVSEENPLQLKGVDVTYLHPPGANE